MADDRGDELKALRRVIETCRAQALDLDMPALSHILGRAESSLAAHEDGRPASPRATRNRPPSVPHGRIVGH